MLSVINRDDSPRETNSLLLGLYSLLMAESRLQYRGCPPAAFCLFWPTADDMFPRAYVETYEREHTGCSGKIVFFLNSLQPLPRLHCCKRPSKLSTQCECTVTPFLLVIFCTTNSSRVLAREGWQTFENYWEKTQYLMNTLYIRTICPGNSTR